MPLLARVVSLRRVVRRLGRWPLVVVLALAGAVAALGIGAGFSKRTAEQPGSTVVAQGWSATAALIAEPRRGGAAYYDRIARDRVRAGAVARFFPLYSEAERVYSVNWRLIASIHRQETAFSNSPSTYHGLNDFGCCAGPMQFNVTNGPVSTWKRYRRAFRSGRRPDRYPHRTRSHPSIYDDFDAIMAAGSLLSDSGAGRSLDREAWHAAYAYYGHDLFGITYANQVLARAEGWAREGFCPNCAVDEGLVAKFDDAYGRAVRREMIGPEPRKKADRDKRARDKKERARKRRARDKRARDKKERARKRRARDKRRNDRSKDRAERRSPARRRPPSRAPSAKKDRPTKPVPPPAAPAKPPGPPAETAPPPADECPPISKLLGCKPSP